LIENIRIIIKILIVSIFIIGCEDSFGPVETEQDDILYNENGVFILNEGNFMSGNGSLSFYSIDSQKVSNNVFLNVNHKSLGDVVQSMVIKDTIGFIVVNNSKKIEVININTYKEITTITGFGLPRYIQLINETKAYVTDLKNPTIQIINPNTYNITGQINVGKTTEAITLVQPNVFVTNWSFGNQVFVINTETDQIIDSIMVTKEPNSIVADKNNRIWVLSSGGFMNDELPVLTCINSENFRIEKTLVFPDINLNPTHLIINGTKDSLYFINNDIYKISINATKIPDETFVNRNSRKFYSISYHAKSNLLFITDALDYNQKGVVWIYDISGNEIDHFNAGIIPSGICYK